MNTHPAFSNNGQYAQYYNSSQSSPQHLAPYSSHSVQSYQPSQSTMSQSASAYYHQQQQQQQTYGHPPPVQSNVATPMPASYAYQAFAPHSAHGSLPQSPSSAIPHPQAGYPSPAPQQTYAGYGSSAAYAPASPGLYPQYPDHGHGQGIPTGSYAHQHQRHSSSSTALSSSPSSQSSQSSSDRFPCPSCDKSFTRNFDRKRHMEIHLPGSAGSNRCRYCHKDYSRPDSLKRHLDNGCDKKPQHS